MAIVTINDTYLTDIADAIREKNGTTTTYKPKEMAAAIEAISQSTQSYIPTTYVIPRQIETLPGYILCRGLTAHPAEHGQTGEPMSDIYCLPLSTVTFYKGHNDPTGAQYSLKTIENSAFYGQTLTKIDIPASVTTIEKYAFTQCCAPGGSINIILRGSTIYDNGSILFCLYRTNSAGLDQQCHCNLYVPEAILEEAEAAYASGVCDVYAIEDYPNICG